MDAAPESIDLPAEPDRVGARAPTDVDAGAGDVDAGAGDVDVDTAPGAEGRRALREARRQRRRTAWLCVAVVALCLALTIAVVTLARYRPATPSSPLGVATGTLTASVPIPASAVGTLSASAPTRGATAHEGGNP